MNLSKAFAQELKRRQLQEKSEKQVRVELRVTRPQLGQRDYTVTYDPFCFGLPVAIAMFDLASHGCRGLLTLKGPADMTGACYEMLRQERDEPGEGVLILRATLRQWKSVAQYLAEAQPV